VTANNVAHVSAGRAHQSGGHAFANGSNQDMGLWNTFVVHTLRAHGPQLLGARRRPVLSRRQTGR
jgi:hypothetical protein